VPKFHKDSIFGPGRRVPMDREQRAVFKAKLRLQRRPGRITLAAEKIGLALAEMLGPDGRLDPTIKTLAALACVQPSTVHEALRRLRAFGFLDWTRRLVRSASTGWRAEQTSNAYVLRVPACESEFWKQVPMARFKKTAPEQGGWERQCAVAAQQLAALGFPVPAAWGRGASGFEDRMPQRR
jgi:hypothetical protein